ncbi:HAD family hydrolase [Nocardiopsis sp. NPDC101807]|uniref:HAD family hydrolase n=1 Tax=Nocardiopsis sp. NPDC101807 TaxID=3364339 RepID=UPI0037FB2710
MDEEPIVERVLPPSIPSSLFGDMMSDHLFVLWDVDHTLLETRGVGREVFAEAFEIATGQSMSAGMATALGHTEPVLLEETLHLNGLRSPDEDIFERFARAQVASYCQHAEELRERGRVLPGVERTLEALSHQPNIIQSVLTGNTRGAAEVKLAAFGLDRWFDLDIGAYGDDDVNRPSLVGFARQRYEAKFGEDFPTSDIILIGDTPRDVEAGRIAGVRVIAVASGVSSVQELQRAGADYTIASLDETDIFDILSVCLRTS